MARKLKTLKPRMAEHDPTKRLRRAASPDSWRGDKTSAQRGYGYRWQQARLRFLSSNPLCAYCQRDHGRVTEATVVDHKVPHRGDKDLFWDERNWMPLCSTCHNTTKKREEVQAGF